MSGYTSTAGSSNSNLGATTNSLPHNIYKDGTYIGIGQGFRPGLKVSVTIKNNKITDIEILDSNETPSYSREPFIVVPQEILHSQSTNVDAVSGATRSSDGIMMAVQDALSKAQR